MKTLHFVNIVRKINHPNWSGSFDESRVSSIIGDSSGTSSITLEQVDSIAEQSTQMRHRSSIEKGYSIQRKPPRKNTFNEIERIKRAKPPLNQLSSADEFSVFSWALKH